MTCDEKTDPESEMGHGIRRKFYDALEDSRFAYPRTIGRKHPIGWYVDGGLSRRPLYGIYAMSRAAEHFLNRARLGTPGQRAAIREAAKFFADTRRAMRNILSTYDIDARVPRDKVQHLRETYAELLEECRYVYAHMQSEDGSGLELMTPNDHKLLEAILLEQSLNGTIPPWSSLFRNPAS